ncbi:tripartite tricarboxylate transporter substrate binding protein [Xylophilus rhododendri]|uniref:Tripartite tricarboxylate transporter substrate binding protein n=1 Tax=Xylophilus rhododendri TaxID=2697032 RepID=A0A857JAB1_9BURK|nr:tripartite tricarboxylate transporter substrate binding protein [Xylophilus rhododendri]QHI99922.1 tripartite tricarboxylate transporter substrate binding protein [Xylophilus rhododendri]
MQAPRTTRRTLIQAAALSTLPLATLARAQQAYPARAVTVVVPQGAGGANDAIARIVMQRVSEQLGQAFVVDNRVGAGGNIGTAYSAKARPDGYTLMLTSDSAQVIAPALYKAPGFDPIKDFEPVAAVATAGYVLVANPAFPANTVRELIALAKAQPGSISYASAGNGTLNHLIAEVLRKQAGIDIQHVPYKSSAAAATDVVSGQVPISVQSLPSCIGFIQAGKLKVLGVVNARRVAVLPDAPTIGETLPGFGFTPWYGLFAPAGTPADIVQKLHAAVDQALAAKEIQDRLAQQGAEPWRLSSAQFGESVKTELGRWAAIVKDSGARVD